MEKLVLKIVNDEDPRVPWEDQENAWKFVSNVPKYLCSMNIKETTSNIEASNYKELVKGIKKLLPNKGIGWKIFTVNAYIHSGIALSLGSDYPFNDKWDSGVGGFLLVNSKEFTHPEKAAKGIVEELNQYLNGDVWGYVVETPDGEHLDSCWGFYGKENCEEEGKAALKSCEENGKWIDVTVRKFQPNH